MVRWDSVQKVQCNSGGCRFPHRRCRGPRRCIGPRRWDAPPILSILIRAPWAMAPRLLRFRARAVSGTVDMDIPGLVHGHCCGLSGRRGVGICNGSRCSPRSDSESESESDRGAAWDASPCTARQSAALSARGGGPAGHCRGAAATATATSRRSLFRGILQRPVCLHGHHGRPARIERGCIDVPSRLFLELPRVAAQPHPLLASSAQLHLLSSWTWSSKQKPKRTAITAKRTAHVETGF